MIEFEKGLWDELSIVCYPRLNSKVVKGDVDKDLMKKIEFGEDWRVTLSKRKDVGDE